MIPLKASAATATELLMTHYVEELLAMCPGLKEQQAKIVQIAYAIAYWSRKTPFFSDNQKPFVYARALWAAGLVEEAQFCLQGVNGTERGVDGLFALVNQPFLAPALFQVVDQKIVQSSSWTVSGLYPLWTMDFNRIKVPESDKVELALWPGLKVLISWVAPVWDPDQGKGYLGLRGLDTYLFSSKAVKKRDKKAQLKEFRDYLQGLLDTAKSERGWSTVPELLELR